MWTLLVSDKLVKALYIVTFCYVKALCDGSSKLTHSRPLPSLPQIGKIECEEIHFVGVGEDASFLFPNPM